MSPSCCRSDCHRSNNSNSADVARPHIKNRQTTAQTRDHVEFDELRHLALDQSDNPREDRASDATPGRLANQRTNIDTGSSIGEHRNESRQNLPGDATAYRTSYGIANRTQAQVFYRTGNVAADCTSDNLND